MSELCFPEPVEPVLAQITVEQVIEKGLRRELGDKLGRVYLINETDEGLLAFARKLLNRKR